MNGLRRSGHPSTRGCPAQGKRMRPSTRCTTSSSMSTGRRSDKPIGSIIMILCCIRGGRCRKCCGGHEACCRHPSTRARNAWCSRVPFCRTLACCMPREQRRLVWIHFRGGRHLQIVMCRSRFDFSKSIAPTTARRNGQRQQRERWQRTDGLPLTKKGQIAAKGGWPNIAARQGSGEGATAIQSIGGGGIGGGHRL